MLGPKATPGEFTTDKLNPEWELYVDDDGQEGTADAPPEELEITPKENDNYVNISIMLPRGSVMLRGRVTGCKRDIDGNTDGRALENPILDTQEYTVLFEDGEVTELTVNEID